MFTPPPFVPARGLSSPHAQTVYASLLRPRRGPKTERERWETPDGDFLDADVLSAPGRPWLLVLHGLEGSTDSGYVRGALDGAAARGWGALALNFRSCSGEPNRILKSYTSGDTTDAVFALQKLRERTDGPLVAIGFSLGANVLLRLLAAQGDRCELQAAAAISAPFDLALCARTIDGKGPWPLVYRQYFLRSMKPKALEKAARLGSLDAAKIRAARTLTGFDDLVTAPMWGFKDAADYYAHSSSGPELGRIVRPTLLLSATDDPIIPPAALPAPEVLAQNPNLTAVFTDKGGHNGFVAGSLLRPRFWADEVALQFLAIALAERTRPRAAAAARPAS